jgi:hypothetical protein
MLVLMRYIGSPRIRRNSGHLDVIWVRSPVIQVIHHDWSVQSIAAFISLRRSIRGDIVLQLSHSWRAFFRRKSRQLKLGVIAPAIARRRRLN